MRLFFLPDLFDLPDFSFLAFEPACIARQQCDQTLGDKASLQMFAGHQCEQSVGYFFGDGHGFQSHALKFQVGQWFGEKSDQV